MKHQSEKARVKRDKRNVKHGKHNQKRRAKQQAAPKSA